MSALTVDRPQVLVIDDGVTFREALREALEGAGYAVLAASDGGEEALELLAVEPIDCILLDLTMPGIGGPETCRRIKAAPIVRDIPLILLTALDDPKAMLEGLSAGADDCIVKSSDFEVLEARVRAQIRRRQLEDENRRIREELWRKELETAEARAARQLAETRAALAEELERKNKELEAFGYSVSHDLRAPLRSIDGFSQALLEDCAEQLTAEGQSHLQRVRGAAQRMGELIDGLLGLSRVTRADLRRDTVRLSEVANAVAEELRRRDPQRSVTLAIRDGLVVEADPGLFRVLLDNLLGNAWKFTSKTADARIELDVEMRDGRRVYLVRDNGAGFDMAQAGRLFSPFQRLHGQAEFPGTGIGLATVHRIVDRHGGRVWAEAAVGQGTTIFFTLQEPTPKIGNGP